MSSGPNTWISVVRGAWQHPLFREPMVRFAVIGVLVFAADHALRSDERAIRMTPTVRAELARSLESRLGHPARADELRAEVEHWKQEEALYREASRMHLLENDSFVRSHLAGKLLDILRARSIPPDPTEAELRGYLQQHRDRYTVPTTYDFEQVFVDRTRIDARAQAEQLLSQLRAGAPPDGLGDPFPRGRQFSGQQTSRVSALFGERVANDLPGYAVGEWNLVEGQRGFHLLRVTHVESGEPDFDKLREALVISWKAEHQEEAAQAFAREIEGRYRFIDSQ